MIVWVFLSDGFPAVGTSFRFGARCGVPVVCIGVNFSIGVDLSAFIAVVDLVTVVSALLVYADDV